MKVEKQIIETPKKFEPFNLILSVETEEEARALYAIFNYTYNQVVLGCHGAEDIKESIGDFYTPSDEVIANGITYQNFYRMKKDS